MNISNKKILLFIVVAMASLIQINAKNLSLTLFTMYSMSEAKVISFVNYKGGVGKTTLAVELSTSLAYHHNKNVLLIDADPQTNATFYLMDEEEEWANYYADNSTLKEIFEAEMENKKIDIDSLIVDNGLKVHLYTNNLHLIPSHIELYDIDLRLASVIGAKATKARTILKKHIDTIKENYDYIIIDCPPNMYLVTQNAVVASDGVIIVALPEYLSVRGIAFIDRVIQEVMDQINEDLAIGGGEIERPEIKGIIFNRVRRTGYGLLRDQQRNIDNVKSLSDLGEKVFENYISESVKFPERSERRVSIAVSGYSTDERYVEELKKITEEFLSRV